MNAKNPQIRRRDNKACDKPEIVVIVGHMLKDELRRFADQLPRTDAAVVRMIKLGARWAIDYPHLQLEEPKPRGITGREGVEYESYRIPRFEVPLLVVPATNLRLPLCLRPSRLYQFGKRKSKRINLPDGIGR